MRMLKIAQLDFCRFNRNHGLPMIMGAGNQSGNAENAKNSAKHELIHDVHVLHRHAMCHTILLLTLTINGQCNTLELSHFYCR